jgi:hypothetical protein
MAPPSKYTVEQQQFIKMWMPEFLIKKAGKNLENFWPRMKAQYLSEWPEELELGLPLQQVSADPNAAPMIKLTEEQQALLDAALEARFGVSCFLTNKRVNSPVVSNFEIPFSMRSKKYANNAAVSADRRRRWLQSCSKHDRRAGVATRCWSCIRRRINQGSRQR